MLRNNTFHKRTAKGKVVKVVREHYLRDDIPCGINNCPKCASLLQNNNSNSLLKNLEGQQSQNSKICTKPHFIIPDTNILLHQFDVITQLSPVILLQTVLKEVEHRRIPIYQKFKQLIIQKSGFDTDLKMFPNDFHKETFIERLPDETPNDYNDRTIRRATKWFSEHFDNIGFVLITDDADNRRKALQDGLIAVSTREYVTSLDNRPELIDMLCNEDDRKDPEQIKYPEHIAEVILKSGVESGKFYQGKLNVSNHNYLEGSIFTKFQGKEQAISILGRMDMNRAIQGDIVVVEILPKDQWRGESGTIVINEEDESVINDGDKPAPEENLQPCGKVVGILKRNWRPYCGFLDRNSISNVHESNSVSQMVTFFPMDQRIPKIKIRTSQAARLLNQRIVVSIDHWNIDKRFPDGHFVKSLGMAGDKDTETHVLLLEHDVPFADFSKQIYNELPPEGDKWIVRDEHLHGREDFRDLDICSIDPPGCTDIDDALHAKPLPNGNYEVGVHIADVTHFVKPGTHMDNEAAHRGTTVYLVNKRIDMLPGLLGTNLCSLHCNVDRLAFSCIWEIDSNANIVNTRFTKSIIRSKASFTYDQAQARIDDPNAQDDLTKGVRTLNQIAKILRQRRFDNGALTLSSPEVRFNLENDSQDPVDVEMKELKDTNALVEEFMLLANISVAAHIFVHFPSCSVLRMHPTPPDSNFEKLKKAVHKFNIEIKHGSSKELADSLDAAVIPGDPFFNKLLRIMTTRCMLQAKYICSGKVSEEEFHHYGLATNIYTHFTSPIRRYSDVLVHRLLEASINPNVQLDKNLLDCEKVKAVTDNLNFRHTMAQKASRGSVEVFTHYYFKDRVLIEDGYVIRVMKNGFVVLVPKYGLEGLIHVGGKSNSKATLQVLHDEVQDILHFEAASQKTTIEMFQKVRVRISVAKQLVGGGEGGLRQSVLVELVEPQIQGLSVDPTTEKVEKKEADLSGEILQDMEKSTKIRKLN